VNHAVQLVGGLGFGQMALLCQFARKVGLVHVASNLAFHPSTLICVVLPSRMPITPVYRRLATMQEACDPCQQRRPQNEVILMVT
jgi:hypothetical protein